MVYEDFPCCMRLRISIGEFSITSVGNFISRTFCPTTQEKIARTCWTSRVIPLVSNSARSSNVVASSKLTFFALLSPSAMSAVLKMSDFLLTAGLGGGYPSSVSEMLI